MTILSRNIQYQMILVYCIWLRKAAFCIAATAKMRMKKRLIVK